MQSLFGKNVNQRVQYIADFLSAIIMDRPNPHGTAAVVDTE